MNKLQQTLLLDVYKAARDLMDSWDGHLLYAEERKLVAAVFRAQDVLSPDEDRGVRDPGTPGEQEAGGEARR